MPKLAPFVYGRPVHPEFFVDRRDALRTLFSRIAVGDSTAIVGSPHIGKSSLLRYVQCPEVIAEWLGERAQQFPLSALDCHLLSGDFVPLDFWRRALQPLSENGPQGDVARQLELVADQGFEAFGLERLFTLLARDDRRLVLLIDEFDTLLYHPHFNRAEFFGTLRALATGTDGLVLVTATRKSVHDMNVLTQELNPYGSPFFNEFAEVSLGALDQGAVEELLRTALEGTGMSFDETARAFLSGTAGRHPYLVQAAGAALYEALTAGLPTERVYRSAARAFRQRTAAHFADLWTYLAPTAQAALVMLALGECAAQLDPPLDMADLGSLEACGAELEQLAEIGIVEELTDGGARWDWDDLTPRPVGQWRVAARGFLWWFVDHALAGDRPAIAWDEWIDRPEYRALFAAGQKAALRGVVSAMSGEPSSSGAEEMERGEQGGRDPSADAFRYDAFISYSHLDADWVRDTLLPRLQAQGLRLCVDYCDFEIGAPSLVNMENAVKFSRKTLLILTPHWVASEWTAFESLLLQTSDPIGRGRRLLPIMVQSCELPDRLRIFTYLDLTDLDAFEVQMERLVSAIQSSPPPLSPSPSPDAPDLEYRRGLAQMAEHLATEDTQVRLDLAVLESRLLDNLRDRDCYGSSPVLRSERARILHGLNGLALAHLDRTFNDLCRS